MFSNLAVATVSSSDYCSKNVAVSGVWDFGVPQNCNALLASVASIHSRSETLRYQKTLGDFVCQGQPC